MPAEYVFRRQIPNRRLSVQMAPNGEFHQKGVGQLSETLEVSSVLNISGLEDDYEMCRELGRSLYLQEEIYPESKQDGLSLLIWAARHGDPEAKYYIGLIENFFIKGKYPVEADGVGVEFNAEDGVFKLLQK